MRTICMVAFSIALSFGCTLDFDPSLLDDGGPPAADADADCGMGRSTCGSVCVDLSTSEDHCGECGHECSGNQSCCDGDCRGNCQ